VALTIVVVGIAEVSLIVSGIAAAGSVAVAIVTQRLGRQRFDHERRLSDIASARRVLDDAASTMQRANSVLESIAGHRYEYTSLVSGRLRNTELLRGDIAILENAVDDLVSLTGRLQIRFGQKHDLVTVYESAESLARGVAFRLQLLAAEARGPDAADAFGETTDQAVRQFGSARDLFTTVAYLAVGAELPVFPP
jgi:hypothetical protein